MARTTANKGNGRGRGRASHPIVSDDLPPPPKAEAKFETGGEAFRRIATKRVDNVLKKLNVLAKLASGKYKYGYTDKDVEHIRASLLVAVNAACDRLRREPPAKVGFTFDRPDAAA
jgi:hypothetical protein